MNKYSKRALLLALFLCLETMILSRKPHAKSTSKTLFSLAISTMKTSAAVAVMFTFSFGSAFAVAP